MPKTGVGRAQEVCGKNKTVPDVPECEEQSHLDSNTVHRKKPKNKTRSGKGNSDYWEVDAYFRKFGHFTKTHILITSRHCMLHLMRCEMQVTTETKYSRTYFGRIKRRPYNLGGATNEGCLEFLLQTQCKLQLPLTELCIRLLHELHATSSAIV